LATACFIGNTSDIHFVKIHIDMIYRQLFWSFFKIGAFTIGGGYAMIPLVEREVVDNRKWLKASEFVDLLGIAQSSPGVLAVNMAVFTGYSLRGVCGALVAALAAVLPSFVIMLLIAMGFAVWSGNQQTARILMGMRPAVAALIAVPVLSTAKAAGITYRTAIIPILTALLIWGVGLSPIYIIIAAIIGGIAAKKLVPKKN
jgi:chromate transporter